MKYFLCSDIHSFYTPLVKALNKAGFDKDNPKHILVVLGDIFDRGFETIQVYKFLKSIPKNKLILIRGNHESLYLDLLKKSFPDSWDFSNGTVRTFCQIAGFNEEVLDRHYWYTKAYIEENTNDLDKYSSMPYELWQQIKEIVAMSDITNFIQSNRWINYLELNNFICVHSWIPSQQSVVGNHSFIEETGYREDWRNATNQEWEDATWGCPWKKAKVGWNKTGKYIVCGHWHTSDFFNNLTKQHKDRFDCPLFVSKKYKLIGLDACTAISGKINLFTIEEPEEPISPH